MPQKPLAVGPSLQYGRRAVFMDTKGQGKEQTLIYKFSRENLQFVSFRYIKREAFNSSSFMLCFNINTDWLLNNDIMKICNLWQQPLTLRYCRGENVQKAPWNVYCRLSGWSVRCSFTVTRIFSPARFSVSLGLLAFCYYDNFSGPFNFLKF